MANLLTITKKPVGYFDFVLNGNVADIVTSSRNNMFGYINFCHFKTENGANIIKEQNIIFSNVTLIDGVTLPAAVSMDDLILKLESIGFFEWQTSGGGSGGVNRFDELLDTFNYVGKDGQVPFVDEAQLRLIAKALPNTDYLNFFPSPLESGKILRVNQDATEYIFEDAFNVVTQQIRENQTTTTPSEDAVFQALQSILGSITNQVPKITFTADGVQDTFDIGIMAEITSVFIDNGRISNSNWTQTGTTFTLNFIPDLNSEINPT